MNSLIGFGDSVTLPSGKTGIVLEAPGNRTMPLDALVKLNDPEPGELAVRWVRASCLPERQPRWLFYIEFVIY
jgi:hypothetical protein